MQTKPYRYMFQTLLVLGMTIGVGGHLRGSEKERLRQEIQELQELRGHLSQTNDDVQRVVSYTTGAPGGVFTGLDMTDNMINFFYGIQSVALGHPVSSPTSYPFAFLPPSKLSSALAIVVGGPIRLGLECVVTPLVRVPTAAYCATRCCYLDRLISTKQHQLDQLPQDASSTQPSAETHS